MAGAKVRLRHEEQTGTRVRFLLEYLLQVGDRGFQVVLVAGLHFNAGPQHDGLPVVDVLFQDRIDFGPGLRQVAVIQQQLCQPVVALRIVRGLGHDFLVDCDGLIQTTRRAVVIA